MKACRVKRRVYPRRWCLSGPSVNPIYNNKQQSRLGLLARSYCNLIYMGILVLRKSVLPCCAVKNLFGRLNCLPRDNEKMLRDGEPQY